MHKTKKKKLHNVGFLILHKKYGKFFGVSLKHFFTCKPFISEEYINALSEIIIRMKIIREMLIMYAWYIVHIKHPKGFAFAWVGSF